ncbi:MAG: TolB-like 6-bladed beta-propeller domain-containing protein [Rikenellaceae bacterium]|nr:TolB-like 6-bladed beta-propeller domain-containing protein [Rikenellaceae bacterium]
MKTVKTVVTVVTIFSLCSVWSCSNSPIKGSVNFVFDTILPLQGEAVNINEVLNPANITQSDDYIIIMTEPQQSSDRNLFYVYSKDDFHFLYSFGKSGRGPNEFYMPVIVEHGPANNFFVLDNISTKYHSFILTDTAAVIRDVINFKKEVPDLVQAIAYVNDSVILYETYGAHGSGLYSYNINSAITIDKLTFTSGFEKKTGPDYWSEMDTFHFDSKDRQIVAAHRFIDELSVSSLNADYSFAQKDIILKNAGFSPHVGKDKNKKICYYIYTYIGNQNIFAERMGRPFEELLPWHIGRSFIFDIEMFDKELNPVALLKFDHDMLKFLVDEDNKFIYAWNPMENFDCIYKYHYDI